jgi:hypothetical protein
MSNEAKPSSTAPDGGEMQNGQQSGRGSLSPLVNDLQLSSQWLGLRLSCLLTILQNKLSLSSAVFPFHANVTSGVGTSSYWWRQNHFAVSSAGDINGCWAAWWPSRLFSHQSWHIGRVALGRPSPILWKRLAWWLGERHVWPLCWRIFHQRSSISFLCRKLLNPRPKRRSGIIEINQRSCSISYRTDEATVGWPTKQAVKYLLGWWKKSYHIACTHWRHPVDNA